MTPPRAGGAVLITGGAGFVGTNLADRLLNLGEKVLIFDSLARSGVERNVRWLQARHGSAVRFAKGDVRDRTAVADAIAGAASVYHLAAQVAVTTSLEAPVDDFEVNAGGTLNVLEAIRARKSPVPLVFTSTNKVYGALEDVPLRRMPTRYEPAEAALRRGIDESRPLCFHSPYGCSKGAADQYVADYARCYGVPAVVLRMSCIYGPHQRGTEDQGWVAHFLIRSLAGAPLTVYGDGRQVRDILFVEDLVDALLRARKAAPSLAGRAFNIGGGAANAVSLLELLDLVERLSGTPPATRFEGWRTGDQRYFVADSSRFQDATGWRPRVSAADGVGRLWRFLAREAAGASGPREKVVELFPSSLPVRKPGRAAVE